MSDLIEVSKSDLEKIHDALFGASEFLVQRDLMNASLHLAVQVRHSPLTSTVMAAVERLNKILED